MTQEIVYYELMAFCGLEKNNLIFRYIISSTQRPQLRVNDTLNTKTDCD